MQRTLAAYYYPATKAEKARGQSGIVMLSVIENGMRTTQITRDAANKRAARKIAAEAGAKPWNF